MTKNQKCWNIYKTKKNIRKRNKKKLSEENKKWGRRLCVIFYWRFDDSKHFYPPLLWPLYIYIYNITFTICNDVLLNDNNLDLCFRNVVIGEKHVKTSYFFLSSDLSFSPFSLLFQFLFIFWLWKWFFTWLITKKTEADNRW